MAHYSAQSGMNTGGFGDLGSRGHPMGFGRHLLRRRPTPVTRFILAPATGPGQMQYSCIAGCLGMFAFFFMLSGAMMIAFPIHVGSNMTIVPGVVLLVIGLCSLIGCVAISCYGYSSEHRDNVTVPPVVSGTAVLTTNYTPQGTTTVIQPRQPLDPPL